MKQETSFFNQHPDLYDLMIPWEQRLAREAPFFEKVFSTHNVKSLIDCGSGTGSHTIWFAQQGIKTVGLDKSDQMIQYARQKAKRQKASVKFYKGEFASVDKCIPNKVDAVTCLGNSMAILPNEKVILTAFKSMHRSLNKSGILVFQVLNFERMRLKGIEALPPRLIQKEGKEYFFLRLFEVTKDKAYIKFILLTKEKNQLQQEIHTTKLFYFTKPLVSRLLRQAGFSKIRMYGDMAFSPFDVGNSSDIIVVAQKA